MFLCGSLGPGLKSQTRQPLDKMLELFSVVFPAGITRWEMFLVDLKSIAILLVANLANVYSNEYFCPVG